MKIPYKLLIGFLTVLLFFWVLGYFTVAKNNKEIQNLVLRDSEAMVVDILDKIDRQIHTRIELFEEYSRSSFLRKAVLESNKDFEKLDNIQAYIDKKDHPWRSAPADEVTPFMKNIIKNSLSDKLREKIEFYTYGYNVFGEVFITNKYGANVAQTGKTSDYRQDDEEWWQATKKDDFYAKDIEYDKSSGVYSTDIGLSINDENGNFIGAIKIVLNIADVINIIKKHNPGAIHKTHKYMVYDLITKDGELIYSTQDDKMFFENIYHLFPELEHLSSEHRHADTSTIKISNNSSGDGEIFISEAHSSGYKDFKGFGWILLLQHKADEILSPVTELKNRLLYAASLITILGTALFYLISISIARQIKRAEAQVFRKNKVLDAINRIFKDALTCETEEDIGKTFLAVAEDLTGSKFGFFGEITKDGLFQTIAISNPGWDACNMAVIDARKSIASMPIRGVDRGTLRDGTPRIVNSEDAFSAHPDHVEIPKGHPKMTSFLGVPIKQEGETIGMIGLGNKEGGYSLEDQENIEALSVAMLETLKSKRAAGELKKSHSTILQQEKMASIGQLAAGVAHEINNPTGFISSNLGTLDKYISRFTEFIEAQTIALESIEGNGFIEELSEKKKKLKIEHISYDATELINECKEGTDRIKGIVDGLKGFARVDETSRKSIDINQCLESTLNIVSNELKYKCSLNKDYGTLPSTLCYPQQLTQVFVNLLVNASHAIEKQGEINIMTSNNDDSIFVSISDTGSGIPADKIRKIFDPFFTTKPPGKGTGLGLSISYDIVKKHGGEITVESEVGIGTTFNIQLPIEDSADV